MKKILFLIFVNTLFINLNAQENKSIYIAFYNVENLFDTINDPLTKDDDFTPKGKKVWTAERYNKKLNDISSVLKNIGQDNFPDLVGFAEIENRSVLEDLIHTNKNAQKKFNIVHEESPDGRGIDVGLIYNKNVFKYLHHKNIPIKTDGYKIRDILFTTFILNEQDTIHIFVNHWKSRSGGQEQTEHQRIVCAQTLKREIDSLKDINMNTKIIVIGDLNDTPTDKSIFNTLKADNSGSQESLTNLMLPLSKKGLGSHCYKDHWDALDNIIVSNSLLNAKNGYSVLNSEAFIFSADWITHTSKYGNKSPNRTYGGNNYYGGYSDHYPVYVILKRN